MAVARERVDPGAWFHQPFCPLTVLYERYLKRRPPPSRSPPVLADARADFAPLLFTRGNLDRAGFQTRCSATPEATVGSGNVWLPEGAAREVAGLSCGASGQAVISRRVIRQAPIRSGSTIQMASDVPACAHWVALRTSAVIWPRARA